MFRTLKITFFALLMLLLAGNLFMLVLQWYHGGHGGTANPPAIERADFIDIVLSVVTVVLGVIALQLAFFTFWGYLAIIERSDAVAKSQAAETVGKILSDSRINRLIMEAMIKLEHGPEAPVDYMLSRARGNVPDGVSEEYGGAPPAAAPGQTKGSGFGTEGASGSAGRKEENKP